MKTVQTQTTKQTTKGKNKGQVSAKDAVTVSQTSETVAPVAPVAPVALTPQQIYNAKVATIKASQYFFAALLVAALDGLFGKVVKGFYGNAATYHRKAHHDVTWFANRKVDLVAEAGGVDYLLTHADAIEKLEYHGGIVAGEAKGAERNIPNADAWQRRMYAEMRIQAHAMAQGKKA